MDKADITTAVQTMLDKGTITAAGLRLCASQLEQRENAATADKLLPAAQAAVESIIGTAVNSPDNRGGGLEWRKATEGRAWITGANMLVVDITYCRISFSSPSGPIGWESICTTMERYHREIKDVYSLGSLKNDWSLTVDVKLFDQVFEAHKACCNLLR